MIGFSSMKEDNAAKYVDPSASPDDELVREVYARFGLCIYLSQVFETSLINILTQLATASSSSPTRQMFDTLYAQHELLTFGNLIKALALHSFLPKQLLDEALQRKRDRDLLAHRYLRDRDMDFMTVGGCQMMIEELKNCCDKFSALDERVTKFERPALANRGLGVTEEKLREEVRKRLLAAQAKYRAEAPDS